MTNISFSDILDEMKISRGDVIMVLSSFNRLKFLEISAQELIDELKERIGESGLLCMPTYPKTSFPYPFTPDLPFSVDDTESGSGWLTELFRKSSGVIRSANPFMPIAAYGKNAKEFVHGLEKVESTFGPQSAFGRLFQLNAKHLGMGVGIGCGANCVHTSDWKFRHLTNANLFERANFSSVEYEGKIIRDVPFQVIPHEVRSTTNSNFLFSNTGGIMNKVIFKTFNGTFFTAYYARYLEAFTDEAARLAFNAGKLPCWHIRETELAT